MRPQPKIAVSLLAAAAVSAAVVGGCVLTMNAAVAIAARAGQPSARSVETARGPVANVLVPKRTRLIIGLHRTAFA